MVVLPSSNVGGMVTGGYVQSQRQYRHMQSLQLNHRPLTGTTMEVDGMAP